MMEITRSASSASNWAPLCTSASASLSKTPTETAALTAFAGAGALGLAGSGAGGSMLLSALSCTSWLMVALTCKSWLDFNTAVEPMSALALWSEKAKASAPATVTGTTCRPAAMAWLAGAASVPTMVSKIVPSRMLASSANIGLAWSSKPAVALALSSARSRACTPTPLANSESIRCLASMR